MVYSGSLLFMQTFCGIGTYSVWSSAGAELCWKRPHRSL